MRALSGKNLLLVILLGAVLAYYLYVWRFELAIHRTFLATVSDDSRDWRILDGSEWPVNAIVAMSFLAAMANVLEQSRRKVCTARSGLVVGVLVAAVLVPVWIALGFSPGRPAYEAFCAGILTSGLIAVALATALVRKLSRANERRRFRAALRRIRAPVTRSSTGSRYTVRVKV